MNRKPLLVLLLVIALLTLASAVTAHPNNFRAHMSAQDGVDSRGQGQAVFQLNYNDLSFTMPVSRLNGDALAAHIHIAADPGGNGPPVISLCGVFGPPPIPVADCGGPGNPARGTATLTDAQVSDLLDAIATDRAYVNVHTTAYQAGEISGRISARP